MSQLRETVLVVVDMQNGFINEKNVHTVPAVVKLVDEWTSRGGEVIFTRFFNPPASQYERLIHWKRLREEPETLICDELIDRVERVIEKTQYSLFTDEARKLIAEKGWRTLVICGIATDGCVLKTAVDAFEAGLTPYVVADACASHAGQEVHEAGLMLIGRFIGNDQIINTEDALALP